MIKITVESFLTHGEMTCPLRHNVLAEQNLIHGLNWMVIELRARYVASDWLFVTVEPRSLWKALRLILQSCLPRPGRHPGSNAERLELPCPGQR